MDNLYQQWIKAKAAEKEAQEERRRIEDEIINILGVDTTQEGTLNFEVDDLKAKITPKLTRRVNAEVLENIIQEEGLQDAAKVIFRYKPELNLTAWKNADQSITDKLAEAITTKPARATFSITSKE